MVSYSGWDWCVLVWAVGLVTCLHCFEHLHAPDMWRVCIHPVSSGARLCVLTHCCCVCARNRPWRTARWFPAGSLCCSRQAAGRSGEQQQTSSTSRCVTSRCLHPCVVLYVFSVRHSAFTLCRCGAHVVSQHPICRRSSWQTQGSRQGTHVLVVLTLCRLLLPPLPKSCRTAGASVAWQ
jgi:hypothetical protein